MASNGSAVEYAGAGGDTVRAELLLPPQSDEQGLGGERFGVVVAHDIAGVESARGVCARLVAAGFACLLPDLWTREGAPSALSGADARWSAEERLPDRRALEDLDRAVRFLSAREDVVGDGVAGLGVGSGGTLAFLLGCTSRDVAAVVAIGGRVLYPALSATKPIQPLELLLNLDRPLLVLCGADDPDLPVEQREMWQQKLDAGGKDYELVVYPGGSPAPAVVHPGDALAKLVAFLEERL